jgi:thiol-disulfide isomerase/thioredoxin
MPVLCVAATWCGDCIQQCPVFDHFAQATSRIDLRFLDRDANPGVRDLLAINGGHRVPVVVFLSEDWFEVSRYGERTLSIYRRLAGEQVVDTCSTGIIAPATDILSAIAAEWLAEFERTQLILRLSPRLRGKYGD